MPRQTFRQYQRCLLLLTLTLFYSILLLLPLYINIIFTII